MSNTMPSINMNLPIPTVGVDPGPDYALNVDACLAILDGHNHAAGSGVQITPSGLNINTDLPLNQNNLTLVGSIQYISLSGDPSSLNTGYVKGGNLFFTDGAGNHIRFTSGGSIVGATGNITGLGGGAAVTYTNPTTKYIFTDNNTFPAGLDSGALIVRQTDVAAPNGITIQSPNALAGNYSLTLLPALPGSTQALTVGSSGNIGTITYDNIGVGMTSVGANAIANTRTRATGTTVGLGGVAISASCGSFSTNSSSFVPVTNLSVTLTTSGRPVMIMLAGDGTSGSYNQIKANGNSSDDAGLDIAFFRGVTQLNLYPCSIRAQVPASGLTATSVSQPASSVQFIDNIGAGTYTYSVKVECDIATTAFVSNSVLIAYEL